jgi:hypothetical protein
MERLIMGKSKKLLGLPHALRLETAEEARERRIEEADADFTPPVRLSARSAGLWRALVPARCASLERLALLQAGLEALDLADRAQDEVQRDGLTYKTDKTGAIHAHPCIAIEATARRQFLRIWLALGLDWNTDLDPARL